MISNDIRESLKKTCTALNSNNVDYMLIGGIAVGYYGYQRLPGGGVQRLTEFEHDIDFWYNPLVSNYYKLVNALKEIGVNTNTLENLIFDPKKTYLRIPHNSFKTEFLPQLKGLKSYKVSKNESKKIFIDGYHLFIISYNNLIKNKKAVNREVEKRTFLN